MRARGASVRSPARIARSHQRGKKPSSFHMAGSIGYIKAGGADERRCSQLLKSIECLRESNSRACVSRDAISSVVGVIDPLATMTSRDIVPRSLIFWLVILYASHCIGDKLSPDQKAPAFARGSGGLILNTPYEDNKARNRPISASNTEDGVQREETEMLKIVDGEPVRTVKGSFSYNSPEGLPISVKYEADENGNKASFKFGTGAGGTGSGPSSRPSGPKGDGARGGQGDQGSKGSKGSSYLPPKDVDRSYLPPQ